MTLPSGCVGWCKGAVSSIGIDFNAWTEEAGLTVGDGAVFLDEDRQVTPPPHPPYFSFVILRAKQTHLAA